MSEATEHCGHHFCWKALCDMGKSALKEKSSNDAKGKLNGQSRRCGTKFQESQGGRLPLMSGCSRKPL